MHLKSSVFQILFIFMSFIGICQQNIDMKGFDDDIRSETGLRIMFYNLENFFDSFNDSLTADDEYSAFGMRHWGKEKYNKKLNNTYKVIANTGGWEPPELIGVCEVENKFVLGDIVFGTPLRKFNYKYIHYDSPDPRGIDVALIYRSDKFRPIYSKPLKIVYPFDSMSRTRDILYVKGITKTKDTLHLFINHFPSKFGGATVTIPKRNYVAKFLREKVDSIFAENKNANIVIMGDFNDEPYDESMSKYLGAKCEINEVGEKSLYNLMCKLKKTESVGTNKFRESWSVIDQIIISNSLINGKWQVKNNEAYIFRTPYLIEDDETYMGVKTVRTYNGLKYMGGFSDHLPVYIDLIYNK